jgi:hypothetical protein
LRGDVKEGDVTALAVPAEDFFVCWPQNSEPEGLVYGSGFGHHERAGICAAQND